MDGGFELDATHFPLLITVFPRVVHLPELEAAIERYQAYVLERGVPYVSVIDATELEQILSAEARRVIASYRRRGLELGIGQLQRGIVIVTTSVLLRAATSVVEWTSPLPSDWTTVGTREAAFEWGRRQLASAAR